MFDQTRSMTYNPKAYYKLTAINLLLLLPQGREEMLLDKIPFVIQEDFKIIYIQVRIVASFVQLRREFYTIKKQDKVIFIIYINENKVYNHFI